MVDGKCGVLAVPRVSTASQDQRVVVWTHFANKLRGTSVLTVTLYLTFEKLPFSSLSFLFGNGRYMEILSFKCYFHSFIAANMSRSVMH